MNTTAVTTGAAIAVSEARAFSEEKPSLSPVRTEFEELFAIIRMNQGKRFQNLTLVTHTRPHLDEIVALWLLMKFGGEKFPGIENAEPRYVPAGWKAKHTWQERAAEGYIFLGVGGGPFDEHNQNGTPRSKDVCCCILVARALGVEDLPELSLILKYVLQMDTHATGELFDVPSTIKRMHLNSDDPQVVIRWGFDWMNTNFVGQIEFFKNSTTETTRLPFKVMMNGKSREYEVVMGETGNPFFSHYQRWLGAKVVVQKNPDGNIQIFTDKRVPFDISAAVAVIRKYELMLSGQECTLSEADLSREGTLDAVPEWFYYKEDSEALYNGTLTALDKPPTKIPLDRIGAIVKELIKIK